MSNFSAILQEYQLGLRDLADVETQIEQELIQDLVPAEELVRRLDAQHAIRNFEAEERRAIERCIWTIETKRRTEFERTLGGSSLGGANSLLQGPSAIGEADAPSSAADIPEADASGIDADVPSTVPDSSHDATRLAPTPTQEAVGEGSLLGGRYRLEQLIGRGGMSEVYKAVDQVDEEYEDRNPHLAVKVMTVNTRNQRDAELAMQREVARSRRLTHENVLRVHHFDRDGGTAFMTMELLEGQSLLQKLASSTKSGLPAADAKEIILQVSAALEHAHEKGIVHADLKPSNVFIEADGRVKVIDFGIARALSSPSDPDGQQTVFDPRRLGAMTVAYASPEMIAGEEADPRDDIYSLGCLAYETYTGKHPFARAQSTEVRDSQFEISRPKQIPQAQWPAIKRALEFDQSRRTPTVRQFVEELSKPARPPIKPVAGAVAVVVLLAVAGSFFLPSDEPATPDPVIDDVEEPAAPAVSRSVFRDCDSCPNLVRVESGSMLIGERDATLFPADAPQHRVFINEDFALGQTEVTVADYARFVAETDRPAAPCRHLASNWLPDPAVTWRNPGFNQADDHPVTCVTFADASAFVDWLSDETGASYQLPSEAEWEYVARLNVSDTPSCADGNLADATLAATIQSGSVAALTCNDGHAFTKAVAESDAVVPTDMRGNLFEWTADCWNPTHANAPIDGTARTDGNCALRVLRGGSWFTAPDELRLAYRNRAEVDYASNTFGFRVVRRFE